MERLRRLLTASLLLGIPGCTAPFSADAGDLPVFPGAQGFGSRTRAGRSGQILHVTTLREAGPGSLRDIG